MKFTVKYTAGAEDEGKTVKQVMINKYFMSQSLIKRLKAAPDGICVNGERVTVRRVLRSGDYLELTMTEAESENIIPEHMELDILYEDEYLLAVNKPVNMASHPSHGHFGGTLANGVFEYLSSSAERCRIHIVTRLDRNTTGVVLFAKSAYVHDLMSKKLRSGKLHKTYIALCEGITDSAGEIEAPIARSDGSIITRTVRQDGAYARTGYKRLADNGSISLAEIYPYTGRTHQIRVHMSYIGHPLVGDDLYGAEPIPEQRHFLHCGKIEFEHPINGEKISVQADVPAEFSKRLEQGTT